MANESHLWYPGATLHLINRGSRRGDLFKSPIDYAEFLQKMEKLAKDKGYIINSYCLMTNHYHLLIRTSDYPISTWMQTLQYSYARYFNSQLMITPSKNLIKNIGLGADSTHSNVALECLPKQIRDSFYREAESLEFPLKHPKYVIDNVEYKNQLYKLTGKGHPLIQKKLRIESILLRIRHKGLGSVFGKSKK